ncbi:hypothetical protein L202_05545 [Cryptococcus amylolentus CBS 6039]|uniref:tRNA (adenine(58)-N(1))-methyltransferase catalytic subunit TRM61 n=2 Tax=Cryptococcus amylolentus TaxID=104669 RepID=A0A1E3HKX4_9TREE|nr:hypothetical protein L202_05545 [Cryptococcus amylolentus CBS 6039]ODN76984.1 hypothetical protein L202_05545 [Cryptococcus amylolentus CBS 6039]ODO04863.1 hypothetical protein I350_05473 [Cryptococcus amylolentus CBS 6273]
MSVPRPMFHSRSHIEAGDVVILYMARDNLSAITVQPGEYLHNKYGRYAHDAFIGQKFGSKVHSPPPHSGYLHLLRPTPELWTLSLPHRTQILYLPDISYITMRLQVRVGGKVIEAGTGSGSMTHSLSRSVGPSGNVLSFEYHRPRFETALEEFESHDLRNVRLQHRNVCKDGFGDAQGVEAIFLDLPAPWEAIPHAINSLRTDTVTRICCFSPCIEQVTRTVTCLREFNFQEISTQEVLLRTHELVTFPDNAQYLHSISSVVGNLKEQELRKEERRIVQIKTARENNRKAKVDQAGEGTLAEGEATSKRKLEAVAEDTSPAIAESLGAPDLSGFWKEPVPLPSSVITKPSTEMKGHTSYLTFALLYPESIRADIAAQVAKEKGQSISAGVGAEKIVESQYDEDDEMNEALKGFIAKGNVP